MTHRTPYSRGEIEQMIEAAEARLAAHEVAWPDARPLPPNDGQGMPDARNRPVGAGS